MGITKKPLLSIPSRTNQYTGMSLVRVLNVAVAGAQLDQGI